MTRAILETCDRTSATEDVRFEVTQMQASLSDPSCAGIKVWLTSELDDRRLVVPLAREELRAWMGPDPALGDVQLIASELVTNAVVHGAGAWVRMSLRTMEEGERRYWRLAVADPGLAAGVPIPRLPQLHEVRGRGLWIVDELTLGCWGTDRNAAGERIVWAQLAR
ncbi:ATP-binding protein [Nonomuraea wenchangensis]|uniref:ATP-binding protein n=1 Tax=Nonomuraea wenchangensis TaxID=568860 RepID=UPI003323F333